MVVMRSATVWIVTFAVGLLSFSLPARAADDLLSEIKARGFIRVGTFSIPPESWIDIQSGEWLGVDAEFSKAIAKSIGVEYDPVILTHAVPAGQGAGAATGAPLMEILRTIGLEKSFGEHRALDGIDLSIAEGETLAIIGPSGSGKSTLLRCLDRLEEPTAGRVVFEGREINADSDLPRMRARVGMVFQNFNLFAHMTVMGNIIEAPIQVRKLPRERALALGQDLLSRVGLAQKADAYPAQLSGGQKQRVAIARCLAMEPRVLLLDEITSSLDPELVGEVLAVIRDLAQQGLTMLAVTHEMGFAKEIADRVLFMDEGQILEEAAPEQLFARPVHPRLQKFLRAVLQRLPMDAP